MAKPIQQSWDSAALDDAEQMLDEPALRSSRPDAQGGQLAEAHAPFDDGDGADGDTGDAGDGLRADDGDEPGVHGADGWSPSDALELPDLEPSDALSLAEELEDIAVDAFDAADSDELLTALLDGVRHSIRRRKPRALDESFADAASSARPASAADPLQDDTAPGGSSSPASSLPAAGRAPDAARSPAGITREQDALGRLRQLGARLERCAREGSTEADAFDRIASLYVEQGADEALPALAVIAARALVRPLRGRTQRPLNPSLSRPLVSTSLRAARRLSDTYGRAAVHALPRLALRVGRQGIVRGSRPVELRGLLARAVARLVQHPELLERLARVEPQIAREPRRERAPAARPAARPRHAAPIGAAPIAATPMAVASVAAAAPVEAAPQNDARPVSDAEERPARAARRIRVQGPVEIVIYER